MKNNIEKIAKMQADIEYIKETLVENRRVMETLDKKLENDYVRYKDLKWLYYLLYSVAGVIIATLVPKLLEFLATL